MQGYNKCWYFICGHRRCFVESGKHIECQVRDADTYVVSRVKQDLVARTDHLIGTGAMQFCAPCILCVTKGEEVKNRVEEVMIALRDPSMLGDRVQHPTAHNIKYQQVRVHSAPHCG